MSAMKAPRHTSKPVGAPAVEPALALGLNLQALARWFLAAALICLFVAAVAFFWPLTRGALDLSASKKGEPAAAHTGKVSDLPDEVGKKATGKVKELLTGEAEISFMVFSTPEKAEVLIQGQPRGDTPVGANVTCTRGEDVSVELHKKGYLLWKRSVKCRKRNIKVEAVLEGL